MNLIQITSILKEKEKNRNKLIGQKEMLMESLKDLGFKSIEDAMKVRDNMIKEVKKMEDHFQKGEEKFKSDFGHLLE